MPVNNEPMVRRQFLQLGCILGVTVLTGVGILFGTAGASAEQEQNEQMGIRILIDALRSTKNVNCRRAANTLEAQGTSSTTYDLHLRSAGLGADEATIIARAIRSASLPSGPSLRSFSLSYNPDLTDAAVVALVQAFPRSLVDVGFVECAIGDEGGEALLRWSKQAADLRMICVEGNRFSMAIRKGFASLAQERANLIVVV